MGDYGSEIEEEVLPLKGLEKEFEMEQEERQEPDEDGLQEQPQTRKKRKKSKKTIEKQKPSSDEDKSEEEETWGRGKAAYYSSNADQLDSDDDEANELEEQEAIRLQKKILQELQEEDFGLQDTIDRETRSEVEWVKSFDLYFRAVH